MGYGKSILLSLRVLALIIALGVAGLGAWSKYRLVVQHKERTR